jgi:hypothetical protein
MQFYANALRDSIRKVNSRRKDALAALNTDDWRAMVYRELQADNWYQQPNLEQDTNNEIEEVVESKSLPLVISVNGKSAHPQLASE